MEGPTVKSVSMSNIKSKLLQPALTSHFICGFTPPPPVNSFLSQRASAGFEGGQYVGPTQELIQLSCSEASLPGSSLATNEINNDYTGVTERHAYRRLYDDRSDFTFYVDKNYYIIDFFENWISYCVGEDNLQNQDKRFYNYRINFPENYKTDNLYITKFERDYKGKSLSYQFINAYPISINSMPVSYDSSQILKCTVSFTYSRYVISKPINLTGVDNLDTLVDVREVPQGSRIVGSSDINNNQRLYNYITPDGRLVSTIDTIIR